ncbi:unnamed protein product [Hydatigera taeniaeformis]|uniref:NYN domain-containing protein n=1 Tax=Hydatigena taeniaeformis TaxID=6205 RepID=A0A0R3X1H8_HYDTA|nr:unnamed protein product [Hydatigera taeniaeformis]
MRKLANCDMLHRVTVFLNPFARQRAILDKFDEDAMPLLQISGLDVQMVYLDDDDEAKKYSNVLDPDSTDAIVVAGDDNLLAKPDSCKQEVFAMTGVEWSCWRDVEYGGGGRSLTASRPANHKPRLSSPPRWMDAGTVNLNTVKTSFSSPYGYYSFRQCVKRVCAVCRHALAYVCAPAFDPASPAAEQLETARRKGKPLQRGCAKQAVLIVKPVCSGCKKCWRRKYRLAVPEVPRKSSWFGRLFGLSSYSVAKKDKRTLEAQNWRLPDHENPECGLEKRLTVPPASRIVLALDGDNIRVNVTPAAQSLVSYVRQAMENLTSPAYHCDFAEPSTLSYLCSSVILCPSRTDVFTPGFNMDEMKDWFST